MKKGYNFLKCIFVLFVLFLFLSPTVLLADTKSDLEKQVEELTRKILLIQIDLLQKQLAELQKNLKIASEKTVILGDKSEETKTTKVLYSGKPILLSVSPEGGHNGVNLTLKGKGFLEKGNTLLTTFGNFSQLSSKDGETITFPLRYHGPGFDEDYGTGNGITHTMPIVFYLENSNGTSGFLDFDLYFDVDN